MKKVFVGWDGNVDDILDAVDTRSGPGHYQAMKTMESFSQRIYASCGKSCNIELVPKVQKIGGNGPIFVEALPEGEYEITLAGCFGKEAIDPLFHPLQKRCARLFSFGPSASTQAIEFSDGKVLFGKLAPLDNICWENLLELIPLPQFIQLQEEIDLFVSANWTMLNHVNGIWRALLEQVVPQLSKRARYLFIDLADPAKRTDEDLKQALALLKSLGSCYDLILGLNGAESKRVANVLGVVGIEEIFEVLGASCVVCHTPLTASAVSKEGQETIQSAYTPTPKLSTGAGDNFNAGFCNGLLKGLTLKERLEMGCATSGFYVRHGRSPSSEELSQFLNLWHSGRI
ncbi:MAG: carbohydrate kinase family protein [Verrucomicrobia bacterium]|nr:carbohydrate kinase family protein [Verrucomicrobiota bacterium]